MAGYQNSQLYAGLKESNLYILTEFFKMPRNPAHIRILLLLMEQDAHVSDLAEKLGMTQSAVVSESVNGRPWRGVILGDMY